AGVHCCGNTDWSILMDTSVDIINFDAYEYFQGMTLYTEQLRAFLQRGGILAWGIVPTSPRVTEESIASLTANFTDKIAHLKSKGIQQKLLLNQALLTPSCGMGTLSVELSERVIELLTGVSEVIRNRYFSDQKKKTITSTTALNS
ncbi:MAG: hypothetical protein ABH878_05235, partial [bacterium]